MTAKRIAFAAAIAAILGAAVPASAQQDLKIGSVNWARIVIESPQAEEVRKSMQGQFASRMEELQEKNDKLESDVERLQRDGSVMSQEARQKLEDSIRDQRRRLRLAREEYSEDVQRAQQEEMQALQQKLRQEVNSFAQEQGYDLIVGDGVLYATEKVDITEQLLQLLKNEE